MNKYLRIGLLAGLLPALLSGCDELIVKDISKKQIDILTPTPQAVLTDGQVTFSWNDLEFADYYRLTVVGPSFTNIEKTVADTIMDGNQFIVQQALASGFYEWRLQGFNAEYQTLPHLRSFRVQLETDISAQSVTVLSPAADTELTSGSVTFSWQALSGADRYRLWVAAPSFDKIRQMLVDETLTETSFELELPDGDYQWRIQASNESFETELKTIPFRVNGTPDISGLEVSVLSPGQHARIDSEEVLFAWEPIPGAEQYRITIARPDFDQTAQLIEDTHTDEMTFRTELKDGKYQWRIQALNAAGQTPAKTLSFEVVTVPDISRERITVIAPGQNAEIKQSEAVFSWNAVPNAEQYRLRIVSPSFAQAGWVAADLLTEETTYRIELPEGVYQWQLQAVNSVSQTDPQTYDFSLVVPPEPEPDLTDQRVTAIAPANGVTLTDQEIVFGWEPLTDAQTYRLTLVSPSFSRVEKLIDDVTLSETTYRKELAGGEYEWRIIAHNEISQSLPTTHSFRVTLPGAPDISGERVTVIAPASGLSTTNRNILFAWEPVKGATEYRLMVASPSFDQLELLIEDMTSESTSQRITLESGSYQWRIQAFNEGFRTTAQTYSLTIREENNE